MELRGTSDGRDDGSSEPVEASAEDVEGPAAGFGFEFFEGRRAKLAPSFFVREGSGAFQDLFDFDR